MKITAKFVCFLLPLVIMPMILVGYLAFQNGKRTIEQKTFSQLTAIRILKEAEFKRWIAGKKNHIRSIAQRPDLRRHVPDILRQENTDWKKNTSQQRVLEDHLMAALTELGGFFELFIINRSNGIIVTSTDRRFEGRYREKEPYFVEGLKNTYIQNPYYDLSREESLITVSTPIRDMDGGVLAVLAGHVDLEELSEIMLKRTGTSETAETYLVNSFNFMITRSSFNPDYMLKKGIHSLGIQYALKANQGTLIYANYRGTPVFGSYAWLPTYELAIISELDQQEASAPIEHLRRMIILVITVTAVLSILLGLLFARTIIRPIRLLVDGVDDFGRGRPDARIPVVGQDEFSTLAKSFNTMAEKRQKGEKELQKIHQELEIKVAERTRDLADANRKLRFTQFSVDRGADAAYWMGPDAKFVYVNEAACRILGYAKQELLAKQVHDIEPGLPAEKWETHWNDIKNHKNLMVESNLRRKSGRTFPVEASINYLNFEGSEYICTFARDITKRKLRDSLIKKSLKEKEILLREIHHRVKNNLQIVQSLLSLQISRMESSELKQAIQDSYNRIRSMALIHEILYRSENFANLSIESYFEGIVMGLFKIYHDPYKNIEWRVEAGSVHLDLDKSIACGLIVNELVSNSLKYAFVNRSSGKIRIRFSISPSDDAVLSVVDDGVGLPEDIDIDASKSLGIQIVKMLSEDQLDGRLELYNDQGVTAKIVFQVLQGKRVNDESG